MTDSQKVSLCRKMIDEFWAYSSGGSRDETVSFLNCLTVVLEFEEGEGNE